MTDAEYDEIVEAFEKCRGVDEPIWVVSRSVNAAFAMAAWCVENGIEEPRIGIKGDDGLYRIVNA